MRRIVLVAFALTVLAACQPATTELTEEQKVEIAAEMNLVLDTFWDVWREADFDQGVQYWENSPDNMFVTSNARILHGYDEIDQTYRPGFASISSQVLNVEETHINVLKRDVVCTILRGTGASTDTTGVTGPAQPFAYTYLWVRTDAGWKISSTHVSVSALEDQ
jgi:hypothetical protein